MGSAQPRPTRWEAAYQAFETPEQEVRKFVGRLRAIGADHWSRESRVVEVFCGRGNGLRAWQQLGFVHVFGVDYSPALILAGGGTRIVGDARALPVAAATIDVAVVQGGLHHLLTADDVDRALQEMRRVVRPDGRIVIIEPWLTPFLRVMHAIGDSRVARRLSRKVNAFGTMVDEERETYERWLNAPEIYRSIIHRRVAPIMEEIRWGKLIFVGTPRA